MFVNRSIYNTGEIFGFNKNLVGFQNIFYKGLDIQPVKPFPAFLTQTMI